MNLRCTSIHDSHLVDCRFRVRPISIGACGKTGGRCSTATCPLLAEKKRKEREKTTLAPEHPGCFSQEVKP